MRAAGIGWAPLALLLACLSGCGGTGAARFAEPLPGSRLQEMRRFYVLHQDNDPRNIHLDIAEELRALGVEAQAGDGPVPSDVDAIVSYVDRYMWDMTMYCVQLTIYVRDAHTGYVTATGWSWRPSISRKTPRGHARLILTRLFGREAS